MMFYITKTEIILNTCKMISVSRCVDGSSGTTTYVFTQHVHQPKIVQDHPLPLVEYEHTIEIYQKIE